MKNEYKESFGLFCRIKMKRHGAPNEIYLHKIINKMKSNGYTEVPIKAGEKDTIHKECVDVYSVICCGVDETEVFKVRCEDVEICDSQVKANEGNGKNPYYDSIKFMRKTIKLQEQLLWRCELAALNSLGHLPKQERDRTTPVLNALIEDYVALLEKYAQHVEEEIQRSGYYNPHEIKEVIDTAESRQFRYKEAGVDKYEEKLENAIDLLYDAREDAYGT